MDLKVVVTGASRGIGRETARQLALAGYEVLGVARSRPDVHDANVEYLACNLADPGQVAQLTDELATRGPFYALVNNAGSCPTGSLALTTVEDLDLAYRVNVAAPLVLTKSLVPGMIAAGRGRVVNVTSRSALGKTNRGAYAASKAALTALTRTWALELGPHGVTVNAVAPGPIDTDFFNSASPVGDPQRDEALGAVAVGRIGRAGEVAHAVRYFLDPEAGFVTGQVLYVDGGLTTGTSKT